MISFQVLLSGLKDLEKKYPGLLHSSRGMGTIVATDADTSARRDKILTALRNQGGVNCGGCGDTAIRLRPALVFAPKHARIFIERLDAVLAKM